MDYNLLIILVALVALVFFFMREIETVRQDIHSLRTEIAERDRSLKQRLIADINNGFTKIKAHNTDCLNQVRKINLINSQPITKASAKYTETETEKGVNMDYLSDTIQKKPPSSTYMSENLSPPTEKSHKSKKSTHSQQHSQEENFKIDFANGNKETIVANKEVVAENKESNNINNVNNNSDSDVSNDDSNNDTNDDNEEFVSEDDTDSQSITIDIHNFRADDNEENASEINTVEDEDNSDEDDDNHIEIKKEDITIGSKKGGHGKKPNIKSSTFTLADLADEAEYTKKSLEEIARSLSLPLMYSQGNKRVPYKKNELYNKIKDHLTHKESK